MSREICCIICHRKFCNFIKSEDFNWDWECNYCGTKFTISNMYIPKETLKLI